MFTTPHGRLSDLQGVVGFDVREDGAYFLNVRHMSCAEHALAEDAEAKQRHLRIVERSYVALCKIKEVVGWGGEHPESGKTFPFVVCVRASTLTSDVKNRIRYILALAGCHGDDASIVEIHPPAPLQHVRVQTQAPAVIEPLSAAG